MGTPQGGLVCSIITFQTQFHMIWHDLTNCDCSGTFHCQSLLIKTYTHRDGTGMTVRGTTINATNREWNQVCVLQSNMGLFPLSLSLSPPPPPLSLPSPPFLPPFSSLSSHARKRAYSLFLSRFLVRSLFRFLLFFLFPLPLSLVLVLTLLLIYNVCLRAQAYI
jgi:hypothetical protein